MLIWDSQQGRPFPLPSKRNFPISFKPKVAIDEFFWKMQRKSWYSILGVDTLPLSLKNLLLKWFEKRASLFKDHWNYSGDFRGAKIAFFLDFHKKYKICSAVTSKQQDKLIWRLWTIQGKNQHFSKLLVCMYLFGLNLRN